MICLDVLRTFAKDKDAFYLFLNEVSQAKGLDSRFDDYLAKTIQGIENGHLTQQFTVRILTERLALLLQGSLLLRHGNQFVTQVFVERHFTSERYLAHGTCSNIAQSNAILERYLL